eukprot:m.65966 g.65966  ORF g.65966 m.65966 type:complete len:93 (-) comp12086_c0_seq1:1409-1687(-)
MINKGRTQGQKRGEGTHQTLCTVPFDNVILKPDQQLHLPAFKKSSNASFSLMLRRTLSASKSKSKKQSKSVECWCASECHPTLSWYHCIYHV